MPSSHLTLCRPLLFLPPIPPSIRVFSNESTLRMRWPKYWSFSFSISLPVNTQDCPLLGWTGWISLQFKELSRVFSNTTVQKHQFFNAQLSSQSNSLIHTWPLEKPVTSWIFVGKVMSLLFNMLSRLVITFLPRSKCLLISWLQSPSAVILEPQKIKSDTVSTVSPSICHEVIGPDAMILVFWIEGDGEKKLWVQYLAHSRPLPAPPQMVIISASELGAWCPGHLLTEPHLSEPPDCP